MAHVEGLGATLHGVSNSNRKATQQQYAKHVSQHLINIRWLHVELALQVRTWRSSKQSVNSLDSFDFNLWHWNQLRSIPFRQTSPKARWGNWVSNFLGNGDVDIIPTFLVWVANCSCTYCKSQGHGPTPPNHSTVTSIFTVWLHLPCLLHQQNHVQIVAPYEYSVRIP